MKYIAARLIVCDTFDYEDYIHIIHTDEDFEAEQAKYDGVNMQRIHKIELMDGTTECHWGTCMHDYDFVEKYD